MSDVQEASAIDTGDKSRQNGILTWFHNLFGSDNQKVGNHDVMLNFLLSTIQVRLIRIEPSLTSDESKQIAAEIRRSVENIEQSNPTADSLNECDWNEAYRLERLLALIEPSETLLPELNRRIAEARAESIPASERLSSAAATAAQSAWTSDKPPKFNHDAEPTLRSLLLDTLEEIHWANQRKFLSRPIRKQASTRIACAAILAFLVFVAPYAWLFSRIGQNENRGVNVWVWFPLYSVLTAGVFGAMFSRLLYLQQNWDSLTIGGFKDARELASIFLRACVGLTGALIIAIFLEAGVINGSLFPKFKEVGLYDSSYPEPTEMQGPTAHHSLSIHLVYPNEALSLLIVWSFLAGFSERLVPSILKDTETSLGRTNKP